MVPLDITFPTNECKEAFLARLTGVRKAVAPPETASLDNFGLLSPLFSLAESQPSTGPAGQEDYYVPKNALSSCCMSTTSYLCIFNMFYYGVITCMRALVTLWVLCYLTFVYIIMRV